MVSVFLIPEVLLADDGNPEIRDAEAERAIALVKDAVPEDSRPRAFSTFDEAAQFVRQLLRPSGFRVHDYDDHNHIEAFNAIFRVVMGRLKTGVLSWPQKDSLPQPTDQLTSKAPSPFLMQNGMVMLSVTAQPISPYHWYAQGFEAGREQNSEELDELRAKVKTLLEAQAIKQCGDTQEDFDTPILQAMISEHEQSIPAFAQSMVPQTFDQWLAEVGDSIRLDADNHEGFQDQPQLTTASVPMTQLVGAWHEESGPQSTFRPLVPYPLPPSTTSDLQLNQAFEERKYLAEEAKPTTMNPEQKSTQNPPIQHSASERSLKRKRIEEKTHAFDAKGTNLAIEHPQRISLEHEKSSSLYVHRYPEGRTITYNDKGKSSGFYMFTVDRCKCKSVKIQRPDPAHSEHQIAVNQLLHLSTKGETWRTSWDVRFAGAEAPRLSGKQPRWISEARFTQVVTSSTFQTKMENDIKKDAAAIVDFLRNYSGTT